jgi:two-component system response regulator PilR (NtrC family)
LRILVVDDEPSMREYLELLLHGAGYEVSTAPSATQATRALQREEFDLVISDMKLGSESGLAVLQAARARPSAPEVILITAYGTPAAAVEAMRRGAYDYICKPFDNEELKLLVQKALEKRALLRENTALKRSLEAEGNFWVGQSPAMQQVWQLVQKVAASRSTVLITGESGTGKELVARAIHRKGARAAQPFLPVNCAALNEGVLESELFGHVRGAFTGATQDRIGILASAGQGTVFLDEIGEIPLATQVKLLRVLQERRVKPVGSTEEKPFEARILAATNKRLDGEVKAGRFREDLFYRLNVITIELPPLRERPGDVRALSRFFLERYSKELVRPQLHFTEEALVALERYAFPGNVRQLQNIVERAATLAEGDALGPETLPPSLSGRNEPAAATDVTLTAGFSLERFLDQMERTHLVEALRRAEGVKTRAAELLGLSFRSFRYRLAKHGLSVADDEPSVPRRTI